jgi:hypothetical protein
MAPTGFAMATMSHITRRGVYKDGLAMAEACDLGALIPVAFENLVNFLALNTLGLGSAGFGPSAVVRVTAAEILE